MCVSVNVIVQGSSVHKRVSLKMWIVKTSLRSVFCMCRSGVSPYQVGIPTLPPPAGLVSRGLSPVGPRASSPLSAGLISCLWASVSFVRMSAEAMLLCGCVLWPAACGFGCAHRFKSCCFWLRLRAPSPRPYGAQPRGGCACACSPAGCGWSRWRLLWRQG